MIGAHVIANASSEFILAAGIMIRQKMTVSEIRKIIFPHPSVYEIFRECMKQVE